MPDDVFAPMAISASGLSAQRKRMEAIARNIANAETTRSDGGETYRRKRVVFRSTDPSGAEPMKAPAHRVSLARTSPLHLESRGAGRRTQSPLPTVEAEEIVDPDAGVQLIHDPHHPDADEDGYVRIPDINTVSEMVDMMAATRAYEANLAAMRAYQNMVTKSLEI